MFLVTKKAFNSVSWLLSMVIQTPEAWRKFLCKGLRVSSRGHGRESSLKDGPMDRRISLACLRKVTAISKRKRACSQETSMAISVLQRKDLLGFSPVLLCFPFLLRRLHLLDWTFRGGSFKPSALGRSLVRLLSEPSLQLRYSLLGLHFDTILSSVFIVNSLMTIYRVQ